MRVWDVVMVIKNKRVSETNSGKMVYTAVIEGDTPINSQDGPFELVDIRNVLKLELEVEILKKRIKQLEKTSWGLI